MSKCCSLKTLQAFTLLEADIITYCYCSFSGSTKGDENSSDVVIAGLLGVVVMVCSVPYVTLSLIKAVFNHSVTSWEVIAGLMYLDHCRNFMTATVTVIFAYVYAFRNRGEGYATPGGHKNYGGERQKLVN
ncbi:hypothetical protein V1264_001638 [Littorina saxatilis]|uniref:Uncharacterized protein n=1 Tax=Littorina saxatilis TaxID=31220 RepID=A0AAN9GPA2_9CAEN